jgi:hypothetical protein
MSKPAFAQRFVYIPGSGSGDEVVVLCELPPAVRAAVREELECEPKVAFIYWHCYIFKDGFDFWTSDGKFVLYDKGRYWELPREKLAEMLGPVGATKLSTPWRYLIPPGLATSLTIVVLLCVCVYRSAESRTKRLLKNSSYQQAVEVYVKSLPADKEPDREDRKKAIAAGVEFLQNSGIPAEQAESSLRLLIGELERGHSYDFRNQAVEHEQAGEWEQAIANYEKAARLREEWDRSDYEFLLKCIKRVRDKQARSSGS